jgi:hypothetical protein
LKPLPCKNLLGITSPLRAMQARSARQEDCPERSTTLQACVHTVPDSRALGYNHDCRSSIWAVCHQHLSVYDGRQHPLPRGTHAAWGQRSCICAPDQARFGNSLWARTVFCCRE